MTATFDVFSWAMRGNVGQKIRIILIDTAVIWVTWTAEPSTSGDGIRVAKVRTDVTVYPDSFVARAEALRDTANLEGRDYRLDSPVRMARLQGLLDPLITEVQESAKIGKRLAVVIKALDRGTVLNG